MSKNIIVTSIRLFVRKYLLVVNLTIYCSNLVCLLLYSGKTSLLETTSIVQCAISPPLAYWTRPDLLLVRPNFLL